MNSIYKYILYLVEKTLLTNVVFTLTIAAFSFLTFNDRTSIGNFKSMNIIVLLVYVLVFILYIYGKSGAVVSVCFIYLGFTVAFARLYGAYFNINFIVQYILVGIWIAWLLLLFFLLSKGNKINI